MTETCTKRIHGLSTTTWTAIWFASVGILAGIVSYYRMFAGFSWWDDEGRLMVSVKQYLGGAKLYKEMFSGYGPVYYFYNWLIRSVSGTAVDHNATRMTSAVVWVLCSLLCAWIVYRLTRSLPVAAIAQVLVFRQLSFFRNEPGHPQELCMLLLLCLVASGLLAARSGYRWLAMVLVGMLVAALTLVKVNIGVFAILAAALAIIFQLPPDGLLRAGRYVVGLVALILPAVLMKSHLGEFATQAYCGVVTLSIAALLAGSSSARVSQLSMREVGIMITSFGATAGLVVLIIRLHGTPLSDILWSLVLQHAKTSLVFWYFPLSLGRRWVLWALAGLVAATYTAAARKRQKLNGLLVQAKLLFGLTTLGLAWAIPSNLIGFVTPFCWLLLFPPPEGETPSFSRILLCTATVLQTLYAYPWAGSQEMFLRVLLIVVGAVSCGDSLRAPAVQLRLKSLRPALRASVAGVLLLIALYYAREVFHARRYYLSLAPLELPGAETIRIPADQARNYQRLVRSLKQFCDGFVGFPEVPSLHLWSGVPSPGPLDDPPGLNLTQEQQEINVRDFSRFSSPCVVYIPKLVTFWNRDSQDWSGLPLVKYIQQNFKTAGETGGYYFLVRNGRQLATPVGNLE